MTETESNSVAGRPTHDYVCVVTTNAESPRIALVTGVSRQIGIGYSIARTLQRDGWTVITTGWRAYDDKMHWGQDATPLASIEADLSDPMAPADLFTQVNKQIGTVNALIMCHCESVDSSILNTTVESFDHHFAVNARATWLLIKSFAEQFGDDSPPSESRRSSLNAIEAHQHHKKQTGEYSTAGSAPSRFDEGRRISAITSDHTHFNMPYGASKGAMDRIVLAAAVELAHLGTTANVINPGATDTGWIDSDLAPVIQDGNLQPRIGDPQDCASLVRFLCSDEGNWINNQLLHSDGGQLP